MATFDFVCLDCGEPFAVDAPEVLDHGRSRCPHCDSPHVRQTYESYLRSTLAVRRTVDSDELRSCHFG